ncbi:MAG: hypothetical protein WCO71_03830 [Pseudomonadota bacterium]
MGILDFFGFSKPSDDKSSDMAEFAHRRFHARYMINERDLCTIEHSRHGLFRIVDLSHHGCLAEAVAEASLENCAVPTLIDLTICGFIIRLEVSQCQKRRNGWALVFKHVHESSIRNLSGFIEFLRYGNSAIAMQTDTAKDGVMSKYRRRFQGDGPFDLLFEKDQAGKPSFLMVTLRRGAEYGSVIWDNGIVITKKTIDHRGEGARMAQTAEVDQTLVWAAAVSCLGLKFVEGATCAQLLNDWLNAHGKSSVAKSG